MSTLDVLATWFLVFITYSATGWCMEVVNNIMRHKKFTNRGFLVGPLCPIYGCGAIIMTIALRHTTNIFEIFIVAICASAILEYVTSYLMEKLFRVRWWDYSSDRFNIHGRICLRNLLLFGIFGVVIMEFVNPVVFGFYENMPEQLRLVLAATMMTLLLIDIGISLWLIIGCRVTVGTTHADATDEIVTNIKEALMDKGKLNRRLAKAFPGMTAKKKSPRKPRTSKTTRTTKTTTKTTKTAKK